MARDPLKRDRIILGITIALLAIRAALGPYKHPPASSGTNVPCTQEVRP